MNDAIVVAGYADLVRIGRGGLGDVYRARRESTGGDVAIKVLRDVSDESVAWHRTRRELTALVSLAGHAHVVQLLELIDLPHGPALVMEYAPNGSLADLLDERGGRLPVAEAVLVARHTASALVAAHQQGIVHRDLKPQNLLVDAYGQVKLCDFGIAALTRSEDFRTRTNALSMRYASPEDLDDDAAVGPASDVYSLGATLLHLVHGAPPSLKERLAPWTPRPSEDADVAAVDDVLAACLQPDPSARPSAADVLDRLEQIEWSAAERLRRLPVPALRPTDPTRERPEPPDPDHPPLGGPTPSIARAEREPTATTQHRPGRSASRPTPDLEPDPRRRSRVVIGAVAAAVAVVALAAWGLSRDGAEESAPPTSGAPLVTDPPSAPAVTTSFDSLAAASLVVVERPAGLPALTDPDVVWPSGPLGQCLAQRPGAAELVAVDCDEPHDLQRIGAGDIPTSDPDYDQDRVHTEVRFECRAWFADVVGRAFATSTLDAPFTAPSAETWAGGDRSYQCFVGVLDHRLVGDATDADV